MEKIQKNNELPDDHRLYTDKYFLRANHILIHVGLNPRVSMKVFARGEGKITGLEDAVDVLLKYSDLKDAEKIEFKNIYPILSDSLSSTPFDNHYFYQDIIQTLYQLSAGQ